MRAYSLKTVKSMVSIYNETKSSDSVADQLGLPLRDIRVILVWLHEHDPINAHSLRDEDEFALALPTNKVWVQFLYLHNIPPHTAAACLNWPLHKLLETCGGPVEWAKHAGRKPITLHRNKIWKHKNQERGPDEPTDEEMEARKREIHASWDAEETRMRGGGAKKPAQVETRSYTYDRSSARFEST